MRGYILWLGSIFEESEIHTNAAVSPAASYWQSRLIAAVRAFGLEVALVSHQHRRVWPRGPIWVDGKIRDMDQVWCGYANLPGIKSASVARSMRREIRRVVKHEMRPKAVISYNPTPENIAVGRFVQDRYGAPWVDLCADAYSPGEDWASYPKGAESAAGHVFLSHGAFVSCPFAHKLHLDGGIDSVDFPLSRREQDAVTKLLYTGMLGPYGGVDSLIGALERSPQTKCELWICGHGEPSPRLRVALTRDPRLRFLGQVPEARLKELMLQADIFLNPRPGRINGGEMNFPSKVLRYLMYGKPVISTSTAGLAPEYADVLVLVEPDDELALIDAVNMVIDWTEPQLRRYHEKVQAFASTSRSWSLQAQRLVTWMGALE